MDPGADRPDGPPPGDETSGTPRRLGGQAHKRHLAVAIAVIGIALVACVLVTVLNRTNHSYAYRAGYTSGRDFAKIPTQRAQAVCEKYFGIATVDFPKLKPSDKDEFLRGCFEGLKHPK